MCGAALSSGCGTMRFMATVTHDKSEYDGKPVNFSISEFHGGDAKVYPATCGDVCFFTTSLWGGDLMYFFYIPFVLVDVPVAVVMDTVLLPLDLRDSRRERKKREAHWDRTPHR